MNILYGLIYLLLAPIVGGIIIGLDRKVTARMQGRVGPPIRQPFYDVLKLFEKEKLAVAPSQNVFVLGYILFMAFAGALFFSGGDFLLVIFALTLSHIFLVLAAYSASSAYGFIGAERELIQLMAFEPMILLVASGMYLATRSFYVSDIVGTAKPLILLLPGLFLGLLFVLTLKMRKSPFDLSTSHHGHQEIVKGITTEFTGSTLGRVEIAHWYETVLIMGFVYLFFGFSMPLALAAVALTYFLEILVDNTYPRFKWHLALKSAWLAALIFGMANLTVLWYFVRGGP